MTAGPSAAHALLSGYSCSCPAGSWLSWASSVPAACASADVTPERAVVPAPGAESAGRALAGGGLAGGERAGGAGRQRTQGGLGVRARVIGCLRVLGDDGEPGRGEGRAERSLEQGVVKRGGGEVEFLAELALDDEAVHRGPRTGVYARQGEHGRPLAAGANLREVVVHPLGVVDQRLGGRAGLRHLRPFLLRGAQQAQFQLEFVGGQVGRPGELCESPLAQTALFVQLREPEPGVHVAEREEQVVSAGGADRSGTLLGERDTDPLAQPGQLQGFASGPARRLPPRSTRRAPDRARARGPGSWRTRTRARRAAGRTRRRRR